MINAKEEMLEFMQSTKKEIKNEEDYAKFLSDLIFEYTNGGHKLSRKEIKCAEITTDIDNGRTIILKVGYTEEEYSKFLNDLDFEYTNGGHELSGTIWFKDNTWAGREEFEGWESWELYSLPDIPRHLL